VTNISRNLLVADITTGTERNTGGTIMGGSNDDLDIDDLEKDLEDDLSDKTDAELEKKAYEEMYSDAMVQLKKLSKEVDNLKKANIKLTKMTQKSTPDKTGDDYINDLFTERSKK